MSTSFSAESHGTIAPGETFSEIGILTHDGREFASGGARINDDRLVAYLGKEESPLPIIGPQPAYARVAGDVQTWNGRKIGRYLITKCWRVRTRYRSYTMNQVAIVLDDGRKYQGRSQGPGMVVTARRSK